MAALIHTVNMLLPGTPWNALINAPAFVRHASHFPADLPPSTPTADIQTPGPLPDEQRMVCTKALFIGNAAIPAGTIVDSRGQWARRYPDHFAPAPAGYGE